MPATKMGSTRQHLLGEHVLQVVTHVGILVLLRNLVQLEQHLEIELLQRQRQLHCMQRVALSPGSHTTDRLP